MDATNANDWPATLAAALHGRVAVLCVGNELRGDDALGPELARGLSVDEPWKVFDCGVAPENWTGAVCSFRPDVVLVIDAIHWDAPPGAVRCWDANELAGAGLSTHHASLSLTLDVIRQSTGAPGIVLGVQPQSVELGEEMSPAAEAAVDRLQAELSEIHRRHAHASSGNPLE